MKKLVSLSMALAIILSVITSTLIVVADNDEDHFTYEVVDSIATITKFDNAVTEITLPTKVEIDGIFYEVEKGTLKLKKSLFKNSSTNPISVKKVIYPNVYDSLGEQQMFMNTTSLREITFEYTGENFNFNTGVLYGCSGLQIMKVYAESITYSSKSSNFTKIPTSSVAYVKNENVKTVLEDLKWPGSVIVDPNIGNGGSSVIKTALAEKIKEAETFLSEINESQYNNIDSLKTALVNAKVVFDNNSATQDEVYNAVDNLSTALTNATKKTDKTALVEKITECETFLSGIDEKKYVNVSLLKEAIANAKAVNENMASTQDEVDKAVQSLTTALNDVQRIPDTLRGHLNKAVKAYESWYSKVDKNDYTSSSLSDANLLYSRANDMLLSKGTTILATQEEIDEMTEKMENFRDLLVKADATEQKANLDSVIEQTKEINRDNYSEESLNGLDKAISEAQAITDGLRSEYNNAAQSIKDAVSSLVDKKTEPAGDMFMKVQKNGKVANVFKGIADDTMAKAERIRITFDCASDVSYNNGATIEVKAVSGTNESYSQFTGTDTTYTKGTKGWTVDLPLTSAINSGEELSIDVFTYSWSDAVDYVYGITKVELLDSQNLLCKTITDRTIAYDDLQEEIAEAEKIEQGDYSDESFAVLQSAIGTVKLIASDAAKEDIDSARDVLAKAIEGLTVKPTDGTLTGTIKVSDENAETEMTVTAVSFDGAETSVTATSMGTYTFEGLPVGDYTLTISGGNYAERTYEIVIAEGENTQDVELNPLGDINGDGDVTTADVGMANSHAKGVTTLEGYAFVCANVSGDDLVSTSDVGMINSHAKGVKTLW